MTHRDPRDPDERLLRRLTRKERVPANLAGPIGAAGTPKDRPLGTFPPGDEGQVWTLVDTAGDVYPMWADSATGTASGQYKQYVVVDDGDGGFHIMNDGAGNPLYILADLE